MKKATKSNKATNVKSLIAALRNAKTINEKKTLRRKLRKLGHKGGIGE